MEPKWLVLLPAMIMMTTMIERHTGAVPLLKMSHRRLLTCPPVTWTKWILPKTNDYIHVLKHP